MGKLVNKDGILKVKNIEPWWIREDVTTGKCTYYACDRCYENIPENWRHIFKKHLDYQVQCM